MSQVSPHTVATALDIAGRAKGVSGRFAQEHNIRAMIDPLINAGYLQQVLLSGSNSGNATLVGGTVTIANTSVTAASLIFLTVLTPGGTQGALYVGTITPATGFVVNSTSATDTSKIAYLIL